MAQNNQQSTMLARETGFCRSVFAAESCTWVHRPALAALPNALGYTGHPASGFGLWTTCTIGTHSGVSLVPG
jgi:hypothetical protein